MSQHFVNKAFLKTFSLKTHLLETSNNIFYAKNKTELAT